MDKLDFLRMGSLRQDAMMSKEKFNFDKHGTIIIGTTDDSFNEKGADFEILEKQLMKILQQMNLLQTSKKGY